MVGLEPWAIIAPYAVETTAADLLAVVIGIAGLGGLIFTALRFRRDDTTAIVGQQTTILNDMHVLNDELRVTAAGLKSERDKCYEEVAELRKLTQQIDRKLDDR